MGNTRLLGRAETAVLCVYCVKTPSWDQPASSLLAKGWGIELWCRAASAKGAQRISFSQRHKPLKWGLRMQSWEGPEWKLLKEIWQKISYSLLEHCDDIGLNSEEMGTLWRASSISVTWSDLFNRSKLSLLLKIDQREHHKMLGNQLASYGINSAKRW